MLKAAKTRIATTAIPASTRRTARRSIGRSRVRILRRSRPRRQLVAPARDEARRVLVDVDVAVEPEVVGVRAQEAADVRVARDGREVLLLERADVLRADLRRELDLGVAEPLPLAGLPQAVADLEHGGVYRCQCSRRKRSSYSADGDRGGERDADARDGEDAAEPDPPRAADRLERPCDRAARAAGEQQRHDRGGGCDRNRPHRVEQSERRESSASARWRQGSAAADDHAEQEGEQRAAVEPRAAARASGYARPLVRHCRRPEDGELVGDLEPAGAETVDRRRPAAAAP